MLITWRIWSFDTRPVASIRCRAGIAAAKPDPTREAYYPPFACWSEGLHGQELFAMCLACPAGQIPRSGAAVMAADAQVNAWHLAAEHIRPTVIRRMMG